MEADAFFSEPLKEGFVVRIQRTVAESKVPARLTCGRNAWAPSHADRIEQDIARLAAESDRFDFMDDEQWCSYLERMSHASV